ncbi:MAG: DUF4126 family protein [Actinomycetota bacterium]|nr:DUF4126 family protein [Actinomycetota bacterium]
MRRESDIQTLPFRAAGLGAVAGLRSMAAPALLARAVQRGEVGELQDTRFAVLGFPKVSTTLQLLMVGEMVADKTPFIPSRTSAPALLGRALSGTLVGAALFAAERRRPASGAVLGALSATAAAYAGEMFRTKGAQKLGVPDQVLALLEDGAVLLGGTYLPRGPELAEA